ncbi:urease accessory protein UreF [Actinokineospora pegani]|uniref:urease accessory protein UreF n=1 Tax=Actinokineospora pegani TaxID=2654637 RepID=UPI0012EAD9BC|nr:urease accessory UreF family protein [Actinokineospora pegani]
MPGTRGGLAVLALADSRFPNGGHVHSGGVEEAVARGLITDVGHLREFLFGRLRSAGLVAAVFAAAAAHAAAGRRADWPGLDAELDARTPSPAQRAASRAQGWGLLRAGRAAWQSQALSDLVSTTGRPHHPLVLGVLITASGAGARDAALVAGYHSVSGPSSAAVRLLGLDPFAVNALLIELTAELDDLADTASASAHLPPADLPAPGSPALDLLAESHDHHHREEVRLFAS